jgi:hypothetical protein
MGRVRGLRLAEWALGAAVITLAVDPGTIRTAWLVYDPKEKRIVEFGHESNERFLERCRGGYANGARHMAIEMVASYGMAVGAEVFATCVWTGRFIEAWSRLAGTTHAEVFRKDVKLFLCNSLRAKDANIRQALIDRIGKPGTKRDKGPTYGVSGDVWSALAVAVTVSAAAEASRS